MYRQAQEHRRDAQRRGAHGREVQSLKQIPQVANHFVKLPSRADSAKSRGYYNSLSRKIQGISQDFSARKFSAPYHEISNRFLSRRRDAAVRYPQRYGECEGGLCFPACETVNAMRCPPPDGHFVFSLVIGSFQDMECIYGYANYGIQRQAISFL